MFLFTANLRGRAGWKPATWRWVLAYSWWLLLGRWLGQGLRSALGGQPSQNPTGPPTRPRRPKAPRARRGQPPLPYSSAA